MRERKNMADIKVVTQSSKTKQVSKHYKHKIDSLIHEKVKKSLVKESAYSAGDPGSIPGSRRSPGEGIATHSSIFAWKIPWIEEPGRLQSMGSQRIRHN